MSVTAMAWAWKQDVPPSTKAVLLALADHADDDGICWPGVKTVAEKCRLSPEAVRYHCRVLRRRGLLTTETRLRPDKSQTSNLYLLPVKMLTPPYQDVNPTLSRYKYPPVKPLIPPLQDIDTLEPKGNHHGTTIILSAAVDKILQTPTGDAQRRKAKRHTPSPKTITAQDLLAMFSEDETIALTVRFPGLDLEWEAGKCVEWHNARGGSGNWKLALKNWLDRWQKDNEGRDNGRNVQPGPGPPRDKGQTEYPWGTLTEQTRRQVERIARGEV